MPRALFCLEMGTGFGHLTRLLPLALAMRARGHEPVFVVQDLSTAERVLSAHGITIFPSPQWTQRVGGLPPPRTYTDILLRVGFLDENGLRGMVRAWRALFSLLQPSWIIADHAPTALFASRNMGVPSVRFGDGFVCPPLTTPMPPMEWWTQHGAHPFDLTAEANVVRVATAVARALALPVPDSVADLLRADHELLCTFPELDHYPKRLGAKYEGPILPPPSGAPVAWPEGKGPRLFGYLRAEFAHLTVLVQALARGPWRTLLFVSGLAAVQAARWRSEHLAFSSEQVAMSQVCSEADAAVCHGGYGTVHEMLLAGLPLMHIPTHTEQLMLAHRVQSIGAGVVADTRGGAAELAPKLQELHRDESLAQAARAFAARHAGHDSALLAQNLVQRMEGWL